MIKKAIQIKKNKDSIKSYVRNLTKDLDVMAERMAKEELDTEAYNKWFSLICSALDLIKDKTKINY
mgnify:FL=1|tara:strand:+ start:10 stop:207 length:198 start_codon:yes stop_codon:yes gene_type:complete